MTTAAADLLFPGRPDPVGWPPGPQHNHHPNRADPFVYVWWVNPGRTPPFDHQGHRRLPELAPRRAFHVAACLTVIAFPETLP